MSHNIEEHPAQLVFVVALHCEAVPLIGAYELSRQQQSPFIMYSNSANSLHLVETGMGRNAAAAGVMFAYQSLQCAPNIAWVNVGIAGQGGGALGVPFLINKITEVGSGKRFYPARLGNMTLPGAALCTVDTPAADLVEGVCYDMEGSAVFDIARRLGSQELITLIKVVSDTGIQAGQIVRKADVTRWIHDALPSIDARVREALKLSEIEGQRLAEPDVAPFVERHHYSVTQRHQLKKVLRRWAAFGMSECPLECSIEASDSREVVASLTEILDEHQNDWTHV